MTATRNTLLSLIVASLMGLCLAEELVQEVKGRFKTSGEAFRACRHLDRYLVSRSLLQRAMKEGFGSCNCGWIIEAGKDSLVKPSQPGKGCGVLTWRVGCWFTKTGSAFCTKQEPPAVMKTVTIGSLSQAEDVCKQNGLEIATKDVLKKMAEGGAIGLVCGWLADGTVGYPYKLQLRNCSNPERRHGVWCIKRSVAPPQAAAAAAAAAGVVCDYTHFTGWCGGHFQTFVGSVPACKAACSASAKCKGVHYNTKYNKGQCWLQDFVCNPAKAGHKGNPTWNQYTKQNCYAGGQGSTELVQEVKGPFSSHTVASWACEKLDRYLASKSLMARAVKEGFHSCNCGYISEEFTPLMPVKDCAAHRCDSANTVAFCTKQEAAAVLKTPHDISFKIYQLSQAEDVCKQNGLVIATKDVIKKMAEDGASMWGCGWLADGTAGYPTALEFKTCHKPSQDYVWCMKP